jgi:XTP/dITP diphosphohydrolase
MRLIFATQNQNKAKEINALVGEPFEVLSLSDIKCSDDIEENGLTLKENASLKARHIYLKYHYNCFADDTGLIVEALNGEPGVHSARYAGEQKNDNDNIALLLKNMAGIKGRKAHFETVICLMLEGIAYYFTGVLDGKIINEPLGDKGFGYDPIFMPDGYDITLAQMTLEQKNKISHRAKAFEELARFLKQLNS